MESLGISAGFWRGKRTLVTGHTGFKGAWLTLWLQSLGADVTGLSLAPEGECLFSAARASTGIRSVTGDIRDPSLVTRVFAQCRPEVVLHLAAQSLVRRSYRDPVATYATNVLGTVNVLEAARHSPGLAAVVIVTSDKCYENRESGKEFSEDAPLGGRDPYSSSKACAELVASAYRESYFSGSGHAAAIATARAGNVIGGGDWGEDRLIPDLVAAAVRRQAPVIRNPDAVRPWQHVLDPLRGYLMLAQKLAGPDGRSYAEAWNFGPSHRGARDVRWIVEHFKLRWGNEDPWIHDHAAHPHESRFLTIDSGKARDRLGWQTLLGVEQALELTVDWYRCLHKGEDMREASFAQLQGYLDERRAA